MRNFTSFAILFSLSAAACAAQNDTGTSSASVTGDGVYRDAQTDHQGQPQPAASPPAQDASLSIVVEGTGTIPNPDPRCALDPAGQFQALLSGTATLDGSGAYVAALAAGSGALTTPSGCAVPDLTVGAITGVTVRAELDTTSENCSSYCAASARADAEAQCGATADQASCRASAEATAQASCTTTCTSQASSIVAQASLGAGALGTLTASQLQGAAIGDVHAELTFDHLEDAGGHTIGN